MISVFFMTGLRKSNVLDLLHNPEYGVLANGLVDDPRKGMKAAEKLMIILFYIRHHLGHRALGTSLNIRYQRVTELFTEVMKSLEKFMRVNLTIPEADIIRNELTTGFSKLIYPDEDIVLVADGGYVYLNQCPTDESASKDNWSGQKKRPLRKIMTICTTGGRIIYSNNSFGGKRDDSQIMKLIFTEEETNASKDLMNLIRQHKVTLIVDEGF